MLKSVFSILAYLLFSSCAFAVSFPVSVKDYGAIGDGVTDDTAAFVAAIADANAGLLVNTNQVARRGIVVPPGKYVIDNLRIPTSTHLEGSGYNSTYFLQKNVNSPALHVEPYNPELDAPETAATIGWHVSGVDMSNFTVIGADGAAVAAVAVSAFGSHNITDSNFDFSAKNTYRALGIQADNLNRVFHNKFKITSEVTTDTSITFQNGSYNTFDLFMTGSANGIGFVGEGINNTFIRCVSDSQLSFGGFNNVVLNPTVEELSIATVPESTGIIDRGVNNTFTNATITATGTNQSAIQYAFKAGTNAVFINPKVWGAIANPFKPSLYPFTIIGGSGNPVNKMETVWQDEAATSSLTNVSFVGDSSAFTGHSRNNGQKIIQYIDVDAVVRIKNTADVLILTHPTYSPPTRWINLPRVPTDNKVITVVSTRPVTTVNWYALAGENISALPTSLAANVSVTFIYRAATNKWYRL